MRTRHKPLLYNNKETRTMSTIEILELFNIPEKLFVEVTYYLSFILFIAGLMCIINIANELEGDDND